MAKMFYTLDEAAQKLGTSADRVKEMAAAGKLQQFRDRDKLMFKRDQIDGLAGGPASASGTAIPLADSRAGGTSSGSIGLALDDSGETALDRAAPQEDPREASGVSVFDQGEIEPADPMAQTQVTTPSVEDEELALETVGSGSGLLDLTRESDDTSLGAELLDEIYPGGSQAGQSKQDFRMESSVGSSGVFDGMQSMDTGLSGPSGLENLGGDTGVAVPAQTVGATSGVMAAYDTESYDPVGSGMSAGLLFAAIVALGVGLVVMVAAVLNHTSTLVPMLVGDGSSSVVMLLGGLVALAVVFAAIGAVVGKAAKA